MEARRREASEMHAAGFMRAPVRILVAIFAAGCASAAAPPRLTSAAVPGSTYGRAHALDVAGRCVEAGEAYRQYADAVRASDPASADLALSYAPMCKPRAEVDPVLTEAVTASMAGDDARALALLARAAPGPFRDYDRGVALAGLRRTDEAARAFDAAERSFPAADVAHRAMAVFGKARAYDDERRCADAIRAYEQYADLVRASDPASADMAIRYSRQCARFDFAPPRGR
jgi:tetratricopeptide (TPR) repeat protein